MLVHPKLVMGREPLGLEEVIEDVEVMGGVMGVGGEVMGEAMEGSGAMGEVMRGEVVMVEELVGTN
jgi:hypothetical protein